MRNTKVYEHTLRHLTNVTFLEYLLTDIEKIDSGYAWKRPAITLDGYVTRILHIVRVFVCYKDLMQSKFL